MWCSPLLGGGVAGAGLAVPGAVGVSGQAAVGAGLAVDVAAVQRQLGQSHRRRHVQLLLQVRKEKYAELKTKKRHACEVKLGENNEPVYL